MKHYFACIIVILLHVLKCHGMCEMVLISLEIVLRLACMCPDDNLARGENEFVRYCPFMEIGEPLLGRTVATRNY